jgi:hypothetical protein
MQVAQINMRRRVMTIVPGVTFMNIRRNRYQYTAVVQSMKLRADVSFTIRFLIRPMRLTPRRSAVCMYVVYYISTVDQPIERVTIQALDCC